MIMQTTHPTAGQPAGEAVEDNSPKLDSAPERQQFKTREQELFASDRAAWIQEQIAWPIFGAVYREAQNAVRQDFASKVFFEHYLGFFREAELFELPVEGEFVTEWFAIAFESAYDLARHRPEKASEWLDECPSERGLAERKLRTFKNQPRFPDQPAHDFIKCAVQSGHLGGQPAQENTASFSSLLSGVEAFFWAGLLAATEARHDPEAADIVEWFDHASREQWNDSRFHTHLIRQAPLCSKQPSTEFLRHPLLRIAAEKYKQSPHEGASVSGLLEHLCLRSGVQSEKDVMLRELHLARWVREAAQWGAWVLREDPGTVRQIFATTSANTGARLSRFYHRVLEGVEDVSDSVEVTIAFLSWQSRERGEVNSRYYGERLETVVECVDAAAWLPWWLAQERGALSLP